MKVEWFKCEGLAPEWKRSFGVSEDRKTVFAPSAICGDEGQVMMAASYDGQPICNYLGHCFVSTSWMKQNYPDALNVCDAIELRASEISACAQN